MIDVASSGAHISRKILDVASDALGMAMLVCDKNDEIAFASRQLLQFFPVDPKIISPGTRMREFLGAVYDCGVLSGSVPETSRRRANRDEWISEHVSLHWRERYEAVERIGRQRWLSINSRRLPNGSVVISFADVTEEKKREEQLRADLERIKLTEQILDTLSNPICVKDRNLNYVAVNAAFCKIHGITADTVLGRSVWDLVDPDLAARFEKTDRAVLETGIPSSHPEQIVKADGDDLWVVTCKYRIGMPGKYLLVTCLNDVTEIAVRLDEEPGTGMPLQIRDYEVFEPVQNCYDPFQHLGPADRAPGLASPEDIARSLERVLILTADASIERALAPQFHARGIETCILGDLSELGTFQTIAAAENVEVDILLLDRTTPGWTVARALWSRSPVLGFFPDIAFDALLGEIHQTRASAAGTDLLRNGVDIESVVASDRLDVLVAEDNALNQVVFAQILEGLGLSYRIAANGNEALTMWKEFHPKFVLMDIDMPVMNGLDAAIAIRSAETQERTPIVAVLTMVSPSETERCIAAGMDDVIIKPLSPDVIDAAFRRLVPRDTLSESGSG